MKSSCKLTEGWLPIVIVDSLQIPTIFVGQKEGEILRRAAAAGNTWVELHCGSAQLIEDPRGQRSPPMRWPPEDVCASSPCKNGATCASGADPGVLHLSGTVYTYSDYTCNCSSGFAGEHCEASGGNQPACKDDPTWHNWVTGTGCAEYRKSNQWCHTDQGKLGLNDNETERATDPINRLLYAYQACPASCGTC